MYLNGNFLCLVVSFLTCFKTVCISSIGKKVLKIYSIIIKNQSISLKLRNKRICYTHYAVNYIFFSFLYVFLLTLMLKLFFIAIIWLTDYFVYIYQLIHLFPLCFSASDFVKFTLQLRKKETKNKFKNKNSCVINECMHFK